MWLRKKSRSRPVSNISFVRAPYVRFAKTITKSHSTRASQIIFERLSPPTACERKTFTPCSSRTCFVMRASGSPLPLPKRKETKLFPFVEVDMGILPEALVAFAPVDAGGGGGGERAEVNAENAEAMAAKGEAEGTADDVPADETAALDALAGSGVN